MTATVGSPRMLAVTDVPAAFTALGKADDHVQILIDPTSAAVTP